MQKKRMVRRGTALLVVLSLALGSTGVWAQAAGEVEYSRGVGFAQSPGQGPRTLGRGLPLQEGDRITTADGGSAIVRLQDGTRMTVRPNTELLLQQYKFKAESADNSMVMQLLRGGLRAVTGLIAKSSPNAAPVDQAAALPVVVHRIDFATDTDHFGTGLHCVGTGALIGACGFCAAIGGAHPGIKIRATNTDGGRAGLDARSVG